MGPREYFLNETFCLCKDKMESGGYFLNETFRLYKDKITYKCGCDMMDYIFGKHLNETNFYTL